MLNLYRKLSIIFIANDINPAVTMPRINSNLRDIYIFPSRFFEDMSDKMLEVARAQVVDISKLVDHSSMLQVRYMTGYEHRA